MKCSDTFKDMTGSKIPTNKKGIVYGSLQHHMYSVKQNIGN